MHVKSSYSACDDDCPMTWEPVCGSNGITYMNACELAAMACKADRDVTVASQGPCAAEKQDKNCDDDCSDDDKPVCGTDGVTYSNRCSLQYINCEQGFDVDVM